MEEGVHLFMNDISSSITEPLLRPYHYPSARDFLKLWTLSNLRHLLLIFLFIVNFMLRFESWSMYMWMNGDWLIFVEGHLMEWVEDQYVGSRLGSLRVLKWMRWWQGRRLKMLCCRILTHPLSMALFSQQQSLLHRVIPILEQGRNFQV